MSFLTTLPRERYSSQAFAGFAPERGDFNLGTARAMAWMCQLAYETDDPGKIADVARAWMLDVPAGCIIAEDVATVLPIASTQVIVGFAGSAAIVAFAGTDPLVLADWITDLDLRPSGNTANGFAVAAGAVWNRLHACLSAQADRPVLLTGHSLGGALAVLTAVKVEAAFPGRVCGVYAFGMPRVGDPSFAASYDAGLGDRTFRLVHGNDIVPMLPPSSPPASAPASIGALQFRHVGRYLHCASRGRFDARTLAAVGASDEPDFRQGISRQIRTALGEPLASVASLGKRIKLAATLAFGTGSKGMRRDPGGIVIELLPPPLRDHMPDRYIEATG